MAGVPSMREESTASWRRNGATRICGSRRPPARPESSPSAASAAERRSASSAVNVSSGGSGAGMNAGWPPSAVTRWPLARSPNVAASTVLLSYGVNRRPPANSLRYGSVASETSATGRPVAGAWIMRPSPTYMPT